MCIFFLIVFESCLSLIFGIILRVRGFRYVGVRVGGSGRGRGVEMRRG